MFKIKLFLSIRNLVKIKTVKRYIKKVSGGSGYPSTLSLWRHEFDSRWDRKMFSLFSQNRVVERMVSSNTCYKRPPHLKIVLWNKERAGFSSEKDNLWIHKQGKRRDYTNNPERRTQHGLSEWKPYREQVMEWHNSVKVSCGGFSQVSLDSNIDNNGMHRCKKITSLMAFMTKV